MRGSVKILGDIVAPLDDTTETKEITLESMRGRLKIVGDIFEPLDEPAND